MNFKVINAGNCVICGRKIKIDTKKDNDKFPNIFFCPRCEEQRIKKDKSQAESGGGIDMDYFNYLWRLYDKRKIDYYCGRIDKLPPFPMWY